MQVGAVKPSPIPSAPETKQVEYDLQIKAAENVQESEKGKADERAEIEKAVNKINKTMELFSHDIRFAIHGQTHRVMIQVIDKKTDEVVSEMPPSQILDMVAAFQEMVGLIVDEKV